MTTTNSNSNSNTSTAAIAAAWHGPTRNGQPERLAFLTVTDADGQPVGASIPFPIHASGWSSDEDLQEAEAIITRHSNTYADAAQGPDAFPLLVSLTDRSGPVTLFEIDMDGNLEDDLGEGLARCEHCQSIHCADDGTTVQVRSSNGWRFDPEDWCSTCADDHSTRCDSCGDHYENSELHRSGDSQDICPPCVEEHYQTCGDCGELYGLDDCHIVDESETVCRHCIDSGDGSRYHYHDGEWSTTAPDEEYDDDDAHQGPGPAMRRYGYHTDANATLRHTIPNTGHTYGAELEYKGCPNNWPAVTEACKDRAILTDDSTVSGELVSAALTAGSLRRWIATTASALTGTHNDTATGLHIHVDRRALSPWQWFGLSHYAAEHASTLESIAGREANQWSNIRSLPAQDWPTFARNWTNRNWPTRYAGLNLSKGPTVEWRICRATKTAERALARFGMIQRLTALGRLTPSQRPQTTAELRGWLAQDANIASVTGWEAGTFNYRAALMQPIAQGDQEPAAPGPETVTTLEEVIARLVTDARVTEQLRYHARTQRQNNPYGVNSTYDRDALARLCHYDAEVNRIHRQLRESRHNLDSAIALNSMAT